MHATARFSTYGKLIERLRRSINAGIPGLAGYRSRVLYADRGDGEDGSEEGISDVTTPDGMMTIGMICSPAIIGGYDKLLVTLPSYQLPGKMCRSRSITLNFQAVIRAIRVVHLDYTIVVLTVLLRDQQFLIQWLTS